MNATPTPTISREGIPPEAVVPKENLQPNALDEVSAFRVARRHPEGGLFFAARVKTATASPAYLPGSLVVFDWDAEIEDGDVVCAVSFTRDRRDGIVTRALEHICSYSFHAERFLHRLGLPKHRPELRSYLLRRYVVKGSSYRLETLDGAGMAVTKGPLVDVEVIARATNLQPWGWHRDLVLI